MEWTGNSMGFSLLANDFCGNPHVSLNVTSVLIALLMTHLRIRDCGDDDDKSL